MKLFKKFFLLFCQLLFITSTTDNSNNKEEIKKIKRFIKDIIPKMDDLTNKQHPFFTTFEKQKKEELFNEEKQNMFIKCKNKVQNFDLTPFHLDPYVKEKQSHWFQKCNTHMDFLDQLITLYKYTKIKEFVDDLKEKIRNIEYKKLKIQRIINQYQPILKQNNDKEFYKRGTELNKKICHLKSPIHPNTLCDNYTEYVNYKLHCEYLPLSQKLQTLELSKDLSSPNPPKKNKKILITLLTVSAIATLLHYLYLTQTNELQNNQEQQVNYTNEYFSPCF